VADASGDRCALRAFASILTLVRQGVHDDLSPPGIDYRSLEEETRGSIDDLDITPGLS
jgi:hypothetical protein